jgi:hypothetical protein
MPSAFQNVGQRIEDVLTNGTIRVNVDEGDDELLPPVVSSDPRKATPRQQTVVYVNASSS